MIRGSCLCGGIRFEADGVPLSQFRFLRGEDLIQTHQPTVGSYSTSFCRVCGSNAPWVVEERGLVLVPAGLLDDDPGVRPALHMFVGSKAPWWEITDPAPQFEAWVPGYGPDGGRPVGGRD